MTDVRPDRVEQFLRALGSSGGRGYRVDTPFAAAERIESIVRQHEVRSVLYSPCPCAERLGLPLALRARGIRLQTIEQAGRAASQLQVSLTGAELAVAESGTLIVGGHPGDWGLATILPWVHVAIVSSAAIEPDLAAAFARVCERFAQGQRDWVWITGPSKTADIAQSIVHGVHGPNALEVVVLEAELVPGRPR